MPVWLPWTAGLLVLAGFVIWIWREQGPMRLTATPDGRMQLWKAALLALYLVLFTIGSTYAVYGLWQADPQPPLRIPAGEPACPAAQAPPFISNLDPSRLTIGTDRTDILVLGCNFAEGDEVRFNAENRNARFIDSSHLIVPLSTADFKAPGFIKVMVVRTAVESNAKILAVDSAAQQTANWQFLYWSPIITQELRLLLLVIFSGMLGACIYSLKSLADYIGTRMLFESWFTLYFIQPFEGAGIAIVFYLVIRGGLLAGASAVVKAVNPFGISAIAALVGMFSDRAIKKLWEIFMTLFKPADDRGDKMGAPNIATQSPLPDATQGTPYDQTLTATGGKPPYKWQAVTPFPAGLKLDPNSGKLNGAPTVAAPKKKYTVKVTDAAGAAATADLELEVLAPVS